MQYQTTGGEFAKLNSSGMGGDNDTSHYSSCASYFAYHTSITPAVTLARPRLCTRQTIGFEMTVCGGGEIKPYTAVEVRRIKDNFIVKSLSGLRVFQARFAQVYELVYRSSSMYHSELPISYIHTWSIYDALELCASNFPLRQCASIRLSED